MKPCKNEECKRCMYTSAYFDNCKDYQPDEVKGIFTEEKARDTINSYCSVEVYEDGCSRRYKYVTGDDLNRAIEKMKKAGLIIQEKTALDKARKIKKLFTNCSRHSDRSLIAPEVCEMATYYEQAIKELEDK